jgi:multiple sugar transport system ATP-binding protein
MTVRQNMGFALRLARVPKGERDRKVAEAARVLHLDNYLDRKPGQLSGGQRQRVAIGRAIVRNPKIFLFDEPLSNLDAALRGQMRIELARLHDELDATMIYVTHDQVEAMTMADRIVVLQAGRIEQVGTPVQIYRHPANLFVAGFMGSPRMNMLPGRIAGFDDGGLAVQLPGGSKVFTAASADSAKLDDQVTFGIRPEGLQLTSVGALSGIVRLVERLGSLSLIHVDLEHGASVIAQVGGIDEVRPHQQVQLAIDPTHCHVFDDIGRALVHKERPPRTLEQS